jgi:hypothetical protein
MLLNMAEKHLQNKPYTANKARFKSGPRLPRDATSSEPSLGWEQYSWTEFMPRPRVPSVSKRTLGSPEAQLGQTLSCSDLGQIALPADRIACAFNAGIA